MCVCVCVRARVCFAHLIILEKNYIIKYMICNKYKYIVCYTERDSS